MKLGLTLLVLGFMLSQFYRAFLAVLSGMLQADIGLSADDLAIASGLWFLVFAAMQLPVGMALDRFGPRRTTALMLGLGGTGGALLMAQANSALEVHMALAALGAGCAPVLMASYFIFARLYPAAVFATLAGVVLGLGSLGNILGALPLAWVAEAFGWRAAMAGMAAITALISLLIWVRVPEVPRAEARAGETGGMRDLLRIRALWLLFPLMTVNYAAAAGLRGLWVGPFYADLYGAGATAVGQVTLVMAVAMIAGNFVYGPLDRVLGTRKYVVLGGNLAGVACLTALWVAPLAGFWQVAVLFAGVGFFGASFPVLMAHGRSFIPPHLTGRGISVLNLCSIGGAGVLQMLSGPIHARAPDMPPEAAYQALFGFFALVLLAGCLVYMASRDRTD